MRLLEPPSGSLPTPSISLHPTVRGRILATSLYAMNRNQGRPMRSIRRMSAYRCCQIAACFLWLLATDATGAVIVLSPVSDGFGTDQPVDGVFDLFYPSNSVYLIGELGDGATRGVLEFSLSAIPAGSTVNSATLQLHAIASAGSAGETSVQLETRLYAGDGIAEIADLTRSGVRMGPIPTVRGDNPQFVYTSDFQTLFASGAQYAGFTLLGDSQNYIVEFGSSVHPIIAAR